MTAGKAILTKTLDLAAEVSGANLKSYRGPRGPQTSVSGGGPGQRPARSGFAQRASRQTATRRRVEPQGPQRWLLKMWRLCQLWFKIFTRTFFLMQVESQTDILYV